MLIVLLIVSQHRVDDRLVIEMLYCRYLGQLLQGEAAIESLRKGVSILQQLAYSEVNL